MSTSDRKYADITLLFLTSVSFFGLVLVVLFTVNPPVSQADFVWRKPVVGSIFALVCVLGALAVFFPNECSRGFSFGKGERRLELFSFSFRRGVLASEGDSVLRGHHPTCARFSSHVFNLGGRMFCATCSGLFLGALMALVGVAAYFFGNWRVGQNAFWMVWVGVFGVALGLLQSPLLKVRRGFVRVLSGAFLAVGAFLILVVVDELARDFFLDVFLVFLSVFWLVIRISLSQWEHEKICLACGSASCLLGNRPKK
jgi:hypothetical protein